MVERSESEKTVSAAPKRVYKKHAPRKVSAKQLRAYQLVCVGGLRQREAAEQMGCSVQNVSQLLQKARPKMKTIRRRSSSLSPESGLLSPS